MKTNLLKSLLLLVGAASATVAVAETPREVAPLLTEGKSWLMLESRAIPGDGIGASYSEYNTWLTSYPIAGNCKSLYTYMVECRLNGEARRQHLHQGRPQDACKVTNRFIDK